MVLDMDGYVDPYEEVVAEDDSDNPDEDDSNAESNYKDKSFDLLKFDKHRVRNPDDTFCGPFCPLQEEQGYELGRQPANTKLSSNKTVRRVRVRGGNTKWRALRFDTCNYSWGSEALTRKTRILDVVYIATNNELVRTQTLVKSAIVQVDAAPFKQWYLTHYGVDIGRKKKVSVAKKDDTKTPQQEHVQEIL
ncbi:40S ribosomal protein S8 [Zea mays]|nr:40S ribosomal protein S8 [Zea mays]